MKPFITNDKLLSWINQNCRRCIYQHCIYLPYISKLSVKRIVPLKALEDTGLIYSTDTFNPPCHMFRPKKAESFMEYLNTCWNPSPPLK